MATKSNAASASAVSATMRTANPESLRSLAMYLGTYWQDPAFDPAQFIEERREAHHSVPGGGVRDARHRVKAEPHGIASVLDAREHPQRHAAARRTHVAGQVTEIPAPHPVALPTVPLGWSRRGGRRTSPARRTGTRSPCQGY